MGHDCQGLISGSLGCAAAWQLSRLVSAVGSATWIRGRAQELQGRASSRGCSLPHPPSPSSRAQFTALRATGILDQMQLLTPPTLAVPPPGAGPVAASESERDLAALLLQAGPPAMLAVAKATNSE